jgi:hypothetical protein
VTFQFRPKMTEILALTHRFVDYENYLIAVKLQGLSGVQTGG